jgi:hypothetical protein
MLPEVWFVLNRTPLRSHEPKLIEAANSILWDLRDFLLGPMFLLRRQPRRGGNNMLTLLRQTQAAVRRGLGRLSRHLMLGIFISFAGAACLAPAGAVAQNLGNTPATGQAVQGQTAAQPEGAFLNVVNWIGNVICPVGAGLAVVGTVIQWRSGRSWLPTAMTAGGLLAVSGITRLVEYFIQNGQAVA